MQLGTEIYSNVRDRVLEVLSNNISSFAWSQEEIPGINPDVIMHRLDVDSSIKPTHKKLRRHAPDRQKTLPWEWINC